MNQRRSSKGRSSIMDLSITILREILNEDKCDLEEITTMMLNNSLPNELRSMAWRIMLGILPKNIPYYEWVQITKKERERFNSLMLDEEIQDYLKVIRKEANKDVLKQGDLFNDFMKAQENLVLIQGNAYDFFKSQSVLETLLTLYVVWKKNNPDVVTKFMQPFHILAGLIYCLYPSILHHAHDMKEIKEKDDVDVNTLYYFLNNEEYFDSDLYLIFEKIMKQENFRKLINNYTSEIWQDVQSMKEKIIYNENLLPLNKESKALISQLNRSEKISYFYLKIVNENLTNHLINNGIPLCQYVQSLMTTLLISSISFENLIYFWDNIFSHSNPDSIEDFDFIDYVIVSLLNNFNDLLLNSNKDNWHDVIMKYPQNKLDSKHILNKALKFKEKIEDVLN